MSDKKIILPQLRFKGSEETDLNLKIELGQDSRHIVEGDRTVLLDQSEQYDRERQKSEKYRLTGVIRPIFKNLTDITTNNIDILSEMFFNSGKIDGIINDTNANTPADLNLSQMVGKLSYDEFDFIRKDYVGSNDPNSFGLYNNGSGFGPVNADKINWNAYLTYPFSKSTTNLTVNSVEMDGFLNFNLGSGLPIKLMTSISVSNPYYEFYSPFNHGLTSESFVSIGGNVYSVDFTGNEKYRSDNNYFSISGGQIVSGVTFTEGDVTTFKRVVEKNNEIESTSEYYILQHKVLRTPKNFTLSKNAFESSIFEDERKLPKYFVSNDINHDNYGVPSFNNDGKVVTQELGDTYLAILDDEIDVDGLEDHLNRPISKLYFTTLFKNSMGMFGKQRFGFKEQIGLGSEEYIMDIDGGLYVVGDDGVVTKDFEVGDVIDGGIYEYNPYDLVDREVSIRKNRLEYNSDLFMIDEGPNYSYDVHHEYKLREFSDYIEESDTSNIYNLPKYANYIEKEKIWIWRDLWGKGYVNPQGLGVDNPFINGCHYLNKQINLYIKPDTIDGITNNRVTDNRVDPFLIDYCG